MLRSEGSERHGSASVTMAAGQRMVDASDPAGRVAGDASTGSALPEHLMESEPVKLPPVLDGMSYFRLGGTTELAVDVRVLAVTGPVAGARTLMVSESGIVRFQWRLAGIARPRRPW
mgnify:CR=1 FL=1